MIDLILLYKTPFKRILLIKVIWELIINSHKAFWTEVFKLFHVIDENSINQAHVGFVDHKFHFYLMMLFNVILNNIGLIYREVTFTEPLQSLKWLEEVKFLMWIPIKPGEKIDWYHIQNCKYLEA